MLEGEYYFQSVDILFCFAAALIDRAKRLLQDGSMPLVRAGYSNHILLLVMDGDHKEICKN